MSCQWKIKSFKVLIIILLLGIVGNAQAHELTIFVENWPPYHFEQNNKIVGISTELIEAALQKAKIRYKLVIYPFKRALITVQKKPNTMLFTVARIPQREDMFAWIGPLHPRRVYLYKLKNRTDIQIDDLEDIKKYYTGVLSGGSIEQFFTTNGFHKYNYHLVSKSEQLLKMLFKQRVDLIPGDPLDLAYQINRLGYKYSELEIAYLLSEEGGYYMIANKDTPDKIIVKIQESLEEVLATGARDRIIKKYVK
ncbi:substrate-binding periplasmic protein [Desulfovibrio gilichinskyi]|uniref:Amino acid ABC transporter substrate-binding protein, PAAT family n=1 Tax=Desulfovibrio gilichinskyi TaxID=1519643 RepID=A0A1X7C524_9BACT|nr:ABC transporter substrate-binding protein [Desulfovibrio gilichinskyi]SME90139.1 amino acid ABC transporter substrate-binding protein, PAAT family [Desulfovibrio gilichinskyi]